MMSPLARPRHYERYLVQSLLDDVGNTLLSTDKQSEGKYNDNTRSNKNSGSWTRNTSSKAPGKAAIPKRNAVAFPGISARSIPRSNVGTDSSHNGRSSRTNAAFINSQFDIVAVAAAICTIQTNNHRIWN
mmetsp:Transcript_42376/g.90164  ORF Transcript_42376/g.90164 Transcript_42376/m.90164 type:complete len:130 (+) Transcript_42376:53-442(+)